MPVSPFASTTRCRPSVASADARRAATAQAERRAAGRRERRREADRVLSLCRCVEAVVAHAFDLTIADLRGASRGEAPIAFARQVAMYVAHVWLALSLSEVGRRFERDRTTVAHACRVVEERRDDPRVDRLVSAIESSTDLWRRLPRDLEGGA